MPRRIAVLAATAAAIPAAAFAAPAAADVTPAPQTITVLEPANGGTFDIVDHPPTSRTHGERTRFSVGDIIVITTPVTDTSGHRAGRLRAACWVTRAGTFTRVQTDCIGVFALANGNVHFALQFRPAQHVASGTVLAATGAYAGLHGTVTSTQHADDSSTDVLTLTP